MKRLLIAALAATSLTAGIASANAAEFFYRYRGMGPQVVSATHPEEPSEPETPPASAAKIEIVYGEEQFVDQDGDFYATPGDLLRLTFQPQNISWDTATGVAFSVAFPGGQIRSATCDGGATIPSYGMPDCHADLTLTQAMIDSLGVNADYDWVDSSTFPLFAVTLTKINGKAVSVAPPVVNPFLRNSGFMLPSVSRWDLSFSTATAAVLQADGNDTLDPGDKIQVSYSVSNSTPYPGKGLEMSVDFDGETLGFGTLPASCPATVPASGSVDCITTLTLTAAQTWDSWIAGWPATIVPVVRLDAIGSDHPGEEVMMTANPLGFLMGSREVGG